MKRSSICLKYALSAVAGFIWGIVSAIWLGISALIATCFDSEPGTYEYLYEDKPMQVFGIFGCIMYIITFLAMLYYVKNKKRYMIVFFDNNGFGDSCCSGVLFLGGISSVIVW